MSAKKKTLPPAEIAQLVDELGRIGVRLNSVALDVKREGVIKKQLRALMDDSPADAAASFPGNVFIAVVSERRFEKTTNNEQLFKLLGKQVFLSIAKVNQGDIEDHVSEPDRARIITEERTGSRTVTTVFKQTALEALKAA